MCIRDRFIPNTERNDTLKIYGDAPVTVSVSIVRVWFVVGGGVAIKVVGTDGSRYVNWSSARILATFVEILYSGDDIPLILIGVPLLKPCGVAVVTVTTLPAVLPLPENKLDMTIGSDANAPTISNSGLCAAKPSVEIGNFWSISLVDAISVSYTHLTLPTSDLV